jgi:pSer/pThr/pTyr-binding forkhead associated (FHA) protein
MSGEPGVVFTLTLKKGPRVLETFDFGDQERILIGRNEDCDVQVESTMISRHHCEILLEAGFHRLKDLTSSHGTFVNGRRVIESGLDSGDELTVGEFSLSYTAEFPKRPRSVESPKRKALGATIEIDGDQANAPLGPAVAKARGYLALQGEERSRNLLLKHATTVFGRVPNADVRVDGWWSPRIAALILRERLSFRILDTSRRGSSVWVNGRPTRDAELNSGDEIRVHKRVMHFYRGLPNLDEQR